MKCKNGDHDRLGVDRVVSNIEKMTFPASGQCKHVEFLDGFSTPFQYAHAMLHMCNVEIYSTAVGKQKHIYFTFFILGLDLRR